MREKDPLRSVREGYLIWDIEHSTQIDLNKPGFFSGTLANPEIVCKDCGQEETDIRLLPHRQGPVGQEKRRLMRWGFNDRLPVPKWRHCPGCGRWLLLRQFARNQSRCRQCKAAYHRKKVS